MTPNSRLVEYFTASEAPHPERRAELLARLVLHRRDWLRLQLAPSVEGHGGWDVVVRIDGGYGSREMAQEMLEFMAYKATQLTEDSPDA